jgi:hypothetical protein
MLRSRSDLLALVFCLLFFGIGCLWISETGIQSDEALFSAGIFPPMPGGSHLMGSHHPDMIMTYVGTLKSNLYRPVFTIWEPSAASVRVPAVLLGALTVWLFYLLVKRTLDVRTAIVATALLATDTSFLLTTRWDWGPVVLQHLCMVGGSLAVVQFVRSNRQVYVFLGFLAFGLGIWDKALFLWSLAGLVVATALVLRRQLVDSLSWKSIGLAILGLLIGAAPFLNYNLKSNWNTFRQNTVWSTEIFGYKAELLLTTLNGNALFGTITRDDWDLPVREPDDAAKRAFVFTSHLLGSPRRNLQPFLLILVVLLLPAVWRTRARTAFLFAAIYSGVTWVQMAFTLNAGTSVHHTILLWPIPYVAMAAVLTQALRQRQAVLLGIIALVCFSNLALTSTYYTNMLRNGGMIAWTDAINPASAFLPEMRPSLVCAIDWGFFDTVRLLHKGRFQMCDGVQDPERNLETFRRQIADPGTVFLNHTRGNEIQPDRVAKFLAAAEKTGYRKTSQRVFYDYNGRPIIEVFKLFNPQRP